MSTDRRPCPRCSIEVIVGLSESGFDLVLDDIELDPDGELDAALEGRRTYTHYTWRDALAHRPPRVMRDHPAGSRPRAVVRPEHRCTRGTPTP